MSDDFDTRMLQYLVGFLLAVVSGFGCLWCWLLGSAMAALR